jgi:hypothetical protein
VNAEAIFPPRISWAVIMADLNANGCSTYRVSLCLGVHPSTAQHWGEGGEPGYGLGRALLRLHAMCCGAALTARRQSEGEQAAKLAPA